MDVFPLLEEALRRRKPGMRLTDKGGSMQRLRQCPAERLGKQDADGRSNSRWEPNWVALVKLVRYKSEKDGRTFSEHEVLEASG